MHARMLILGSMAALALAMAWRASGAEPTASQAAGAHPTRAKEPVRLARAPKKATAKKTPRAKTTRPGDEPSVATAQVANPLVMLVRDPLVQAEIKLTADQKRRVATAIEEVDVSLWRLRDVQTDEGRQKTQQLISQVDNALRSILEPGQHQRLDQLVLQAQGLVGLTLPARVEALSLDRDQVAEILDILRETQKEIDGLRKQAKGKPSEAQNRRAAELRAAERGKVRDVLSPAQQAKLGDVAGELFDFAGMRQASSQAPEFEQIQAWINSEPLTMSSLRGKVVALHFWTFG